jgi:hypothetical protein
MVARVGLGSEAGVSMQVVHHPEVLRSSDGRWMVRCPECERTGATEAPIGIGSPVRSEHEAQLMRDNHVARRGRPVGR